MLKLEPFQACPYGALCGYSIDFIGEEFRYCAGTDAERDAVFICELWAENYENKENV